MQSMTWQEIFKHISPEDMEKAEQDIDWILTALEHPTYISGKGDHSNMFELNSSNMYYVEYVRRVLEEKGYNKFRHKDRFISIEKENRHIERKSEEDRVP